MASQAQPDKPMSTIEEAPTHKMSPHEKGEIGVERAMEEFRAEGGTVYNTEVTIEVDGVRTRLDFVGEKDGVLHLFEVKNGPHAGMTKNQSIVWPKLEANHPFTPKGNKAMKIPGFTIGEEFKGNWIPKYIKY